MSDRPTIDFYSPFLSASQKASLRFVDEGLRDDSDQQVREGIALFLADSFLLTREAVQRNWPELSPAVLEAIRDDDSKAAQPLRQILWNGDELSAFAQRLLSWHEGAPPEAFLPMTVPELNDYLGASVDFYAGLQIPREDGLEPPLLSSAGPLAEAGAALPEPRAMSLVETTAPSAMELPGVVEELASETLPPEIPEAPPEPRAGGRLASAARLQPGVVDDGTEILEMSAAPLSPLEQRSHLVVKKKFLGYGKNSDGVMGYCGQLTLCRFDDQELKGGLECSNPLLFLSPTLLSGKSATVTYWMPPAAFPQPSGHLSIRTPEHNKVLSVGSLFPQSRTDFLNGRQVLLLLLAPSILGLLYFSFVYLLSASGIVEQVKTLFPEAFTAALAGSPGANFRSQGVGLYQLEVVPASESLQLIWAALIWFCPLLSTKFFRHLSRNRQRVFGAVLAAALVLPTAGLFGIWKAQKSLFPLFDHVDFAPLDLRHFLPWSFGLNLLIALYLFLSVHGAWDRMVASKELRFLLPVGLSCAYLALAFLLIFARSWTA